MNTVGLLCLVMLGIAALLCIYRIARGPTMLNRTMAADVFIAAAAAGLGVDAAVGQHATALPILAVLSMLGFLGSVSIARFTSIGADKADE